MDFQSVLSLEQERAVFGSPFFFAAGETGDAKSAGYCNLADAG